MMASRNMSDGKRKSSRFSQFAIFLLFREPYSVGYVRGADKTGSTECVIIILYYGQQG